MAWIVTTESILTPLSKRFFGCEYTGSVSYVGCLEKILSPKETKINGIGVILIVGKKPYRHFFHPDLFNFLLEEHRDGPLWVQIIEGSDEIVVKLVDPQTHKLYPDERIMAKAPFAPMETKRIAFSLDGEPYEF